MRDKNMKKLMRASFCLLLLLVVLLLLLTMRYVLEKKQSDEPKKAETTETAADLSDDTTEIGTEELVDGTQGGTEIETETVQTGVVTLSNTPIENVESLDNTSQGWGMGPTRDEFNRPVDALNYEEKFAPYSVDFIKDTEEKVIYLTFDEGYEYGMTPQILDTLKEKNAKAVFFVTKPYAESDPELVQRMIDEGHIVGNHTVHHPSAGMPSLSIADQTNEIVETDAYIKENFGYAMYLFRYPTGQFSEQSLAVVNNCNYRSVFWSFAYRDWDVDNQPDETESLNLLMQKLHPGAIYLLHAESQTNTNILGSFIDQVRAQGYEIGVYSDTLQ